MGNGRDFYSGVRKGNKSEYVSISETKVVNGVRGKVLKKRGGADDHSSLPKFSGQSDLYFRKNIKGICQARLYIDKEMYLDFDWGHEHSNKKDGRVFPEGIVHVQVWIKDDNDNDNFVRMSNDARYMNNKEMKKYGPLIKTFRPDVKFR
jgi:hypothetical protein